jgi:hypothetical protein
MSWQHEPVVPDRCPTCERPNYHPSHHHLVPRSKGGRVTETMCDDCHRAVHQIFTNNELEMTYNTVESLLAHPGFAKQVAFFRKQDPTRRCKTKQTKERRRHN